MPTYLWWAIIFPGMDENWSQTMTLRMCIPIPGSATVRRKMDLEVVSQSRNLRKGGIPGLSPSPKAITRVLKRKGEVEELGREMWPWNSGSRTGCAVVLEDRKRNSSLGTHWPLQLKNARMQISQSHQKRAHGQELDSNTERLVSHFWTIGL